MLHPCLFSHLSFNFFFLMIFHTHGETLQNGQSWPGRKICTFSIFVLCTALLILNPIIYYLNPSMKKNLLKRSLCVYVNNTKKVSTLEKDKKKIKFVAKKSIRSDAMVTPADDFRKILSPNHLFLWLCHSSLECH